MRQQLMALKAGRHPVTGYRLPAPSSNGAAIGSGTYAALKPKISEDESFKQYIPETFSEPLPVGGDSAERKRWLLRGRLLCKQGKEERRKRRLRRKEAKIEVRELIRTFCEDDASEPLASSESLIEEVADDASDEEFWTSMPSVIDRERHILEIPTKPSRNFPGKTTRSRLELLEQVAMHRKDYVRIIHRVHVGSYWAVNLQHVDLIRIASCGNSCA